MDFSNKSVIITGLEMESGEELLYIMQKKGPMLF